MTEQKTSQAQQNWGWQALGGIADEQLARLSAYADQASRMEQEYVERMNRATDECMKLMKDSLAEGSRVSQEWRRISLDVARRMVDAASGRG